MTEQSRLNVRIIGASAGTGKTTRLTREFVKVVTVPDTGATISPDKILVSTFTNKAADELTSRIREKLIEEGEWTFAQLVRSGYVGTVNSICGKILQDYALEGGLSPIQNVIPEQIEKVIFAVAVDPVIDLFGQEIEETAARLGFDEMSRDVKFSDSIHWTAFVGDICRFARANRISTSDFAECAERSWKGLARCLPARIDTQTADELDDRLLEALESCLSGLQAANDSTKKTQSAIETLREISARSRRTNLSWYDWATISKIEVSKASNSILSRLLSIASLHSSHPRLHEDLKSFILQIFACAAEALGAFQEYKSAAGLVDFTDQEYLALELLENQDICDSLRSRISLALIDEFQDTSPIQLSLFLKFATIARESVWVGDIKQAIYGFRGTDPVLMQAATRAFSTGTLERLESSYRSRPQLVTFSNRVFEESFSAFGFKREDVVVQASRAELRGGPEPAIELWECGGEKLDDCYLSLAQAVRQLLDRSTITVIFDKDANKQRTLQGSDIAILCRSNDRAEGVAQSLSAAGLKVALTRIGLLDTPECILALATFRYLVDRSDRLALAEMVHLTRDYKDENQSKWLGEWLANAEHPEDLLSGNEQLEAARNILATLTPLETLQVAITAGGVLESVAAWGNVRQRTSNIDALRGMVIDYENICAMQKAAASAGGFINHVQRLRDVKGPASMDTDAIQVLTYHGSKGLEWPVVVLTDLDKNSAPQVHKDLCKVSVEAVDGVFDPERPLQGRWIRFWPWPYGKQEQGVHLDGSAISSPEYAAMRLRLRSESIRLLYVGVTRARDMLIFAPYTGRRGQGNGMDWIDELQDANGKPILQFPVNEGVGAIVIGESEHAVNVRSFRAQATSVMSQASKEKVYVSRTDGPRIHPPFLLKPSKINAQTSDGAQIAIQITVPIVDIGDRIPISGKVEMDLLGDCVHRFLAADKRDLSEDERLSIAERLRELWSISQISSASMLEMSDRLAKFIDGKFGRCIWYRECPVFGRAGLQRVRGVIDLLLETETSLIIIDHKSFPGASDKWAGKAISYLEQLKLYRDVMIQATKKPVSEIYIHMPIVGKILDLTSACEDKLKSK